MIINNIYIFLKTCYTKIFLSLFFDFRNRDNAGEKKRYLKRVVEKLGRKNIPDFKSLKNQGMLFFSTVNCVNTINFNS